MNEGLSMSEARTAGAVDARPVAPGDTPSAGHMLRRMREAAGVDPAVLASAMKVSLQKIEALENDQLDQLPDLTFARGLAAAICRAFGVDPAPVLERMPVSSPGLRQPQGGVNQPFRRSGDGPAPMLASSFSRPLMIAVIGLLLAAAALWLLPTLPIQLGSSEPATATPGEEIVESTAVPEPVATPPAPPPPVVVEPAEPPAPPAAAEPAASAEAAAAAPAAPDLLSFAASGETWITVRDASGKTLINRALAKDEVVALNAEPPLAVTIGRKDAVSVKVRGEPFDLKAVGRSNVARFRVE